MRDVEPHWQALYSMKKRFSRRFFRWAIGLLSLIIILLVGAVSLVIWRPTDVVVYLVNRLEPRCRFTANSIRWTSINSIRIEKAQVGQTLKIPRAHLRWEWKKLWDRRLEEIKLEQAEVFLDLGELGRFGENAGPRSIIISSRGPPWHLKKFVLERGGLVMVGLGAGMARLALEVEGEYNDVPFGGELSEADLQKNRRIELRNIHIHSPLDLAVTLLKIESAALEFRYAGLRARELDSLFFKRPTLEVDRQFFWFVEELRQARAAGPPRPPSPGPVWKTRSFHIQEGRLDITRLREIAIQFPFEFEVTRKNMNLEDLSLVDFQIEMNIPNQNIAWDPMQMVFQNIRGKIAFNLGEPQTRVNVTDAVAQHANNVVNTLYVDVIHWRQMQLTEGWLSMTFTPKEIGSQFGGAFASGYVNGGVSFSWSSRDPWRAWGSAADVDAGQVFTALGFESFSMDGHAQLLFDLNGKEADLRGTLKLTSLSRGTIQIRSLDHMLDRIRENTEGLKQELMQTFVQGLRDYPYKNYVMEIHYSRPDAILNFRSESDLGSRKLDLTWHGRNYEK